MRFVLDLVYLVLLLAVSPFLLLKSWRTGKYKEGWPEKVLGKAPRRINNRPCIWFHAVSVGEVLALRPLVSELLKRRPGWDVVISTTTETGLGVARREFPDLITFFAPLDFSWATRQAVARIHPSALVLVELEIWPNLIAAARRAGARVAVVNGRLSQSSYAGYSKIKRLLATTLNQLDLVAVQGDEYADRFIDLGVPESRVKITGSVKYDGLETDRDNSRSLQLRRELKLHPADLVFVAGSTMEGEESAALAAYQKALKQHPRLRLILVPRHVERAEKLEAWLNSQGVSVLRRSKGQPPQAAPNARPPVILVDTMGELGAVWGLADLAFVGGSMYPGRNGQNMMEPAAYGATVMFGNYTSNFREAVDGLLTRAAATRVASPDELASCLIRDLDDPEMATRRGVAAREFVLAQQGAAGRTLAELDILLENSLRRRTALIFH